MEHKVIHLKERFPALGENGRDAIVEAYLQQNMSEMGRQARKRPVMIVVPGGGYGFCSQREAEPIALRFLPDGFNVFAITYSVAPNPFPAQLCEVAALLELIYENGEVWNCDTDKIAIIGFSAGGHLAAHYSNTYDCPQVRAMFPDSKPVNAAVLAYPVISADPAIGHMDSFTNLTGKAERTPEEIEAFSCHRLVNKKTPPTFLYHMGGDTLVPVQNSLVYAQALADCHVPFELHIYPGGWHGTSTCDVQTGDNLTQEILRSGQWMENASAWLKQIGIAY